jgi:hypothetical protein
MLLLLYALHRQKNVTVFTRGAESVLVCSFGVFYREPPHEKPHMRRRSVARPNNDSVVRLIFLLLRLGDTCMHITLTLDGHHFLDCSQP